MDTLFIVMQTETYSTFHASTPRIFNSKEKAQEEIKDYLMSEIDHLEFLSREKRISLMDICLTDGKLEYSDKNCDITLQDGYAELYDFSDDCESRSSYEIYGIDVDNQTIDFEWDD